MNFARKQWQLGPSKYPIYMFLVGPPALPDLSPEKQTPENKTLQKPIGPMGLVFNLHLP